MRKATLQFDLNDPDDRIEYKIVHQASDMYIALEGISQYLRTIHRHGESDTIDIEELRGKFFEILDDHDVKIY